VLGIETESKTDMDNRTAPLVRSLAVAAVAVFLVVGAAFGSDALTKQSGSPVAPVLANQSGHSAEPAEIHDDTTGTSVEDQDEDATGTSVEDQDDETTGANADQSGEHQGENLDDQDQHDGSDEGSHQSVGHDRGDSSDD
jgi:hypothetical protein